MAIATDVYPFLLAGRPVTRTGTETSTGPATGETLGVYAVGARADVLAAIDAAQQVLERGLPAYERAEILDRVASLLGERRDEIAKLVSAEVGKPIKLAHVEIDRACSTFRFSAAQARTLTGRTVPMDAAAAGVGKLGFTMAMPIGVVAAITPFNFPVNLVAHKLGPALAAGCPVVLKPAPQAVLTALALAQVLLDAGLPDGWLSVVPGSAEEIGEVMISDARVKAITFTGSTRVGWMLRERAPRKKVLLELGGSAPAIIEPDADIEAAAAKLAASAFGFAGQSCVSAQRIYVHRDIAEPFTAALLNKTTELVVGDPSDPSVDVGPLIDRPAVERLKDWIDEARGAGASVLSGSDFVDRQTLMPTVMSDIQHELRLVQQEAFGPIVGIRAYDDVTTAMAWCNDTPYALQASVFTRDITVAIDAARGLRFGAVLINEAPTFRADHMPYGGLGDSGNTREGPASTVRELTEGRLVLLEGVSRDR
jgi:acyl-CoA reductase-like NAD-dependent aldehyde dehydrogenase